MKRRLRFIQLMTGQWGEKGDKQFTIIGLTSDGSVYRYVHSLGGWEAYSMIEVERSQ